VNDDERHEHHELGQYYVSTVCTYIL
jgi:hypothetical protein